MVSLGRAYRSSGLFGFAWVHSGAPSGRRVRVCSLGRRVHSGSSGFPRARQGSLGSLGFAWVHSGAAMVHWVHSGLRGFTRARTVFVVDVRVGSLGLA